MATTLTVPRAREATIMGGRFAGLLLFVLAAQFMAVIMLAASMAPGYDIQDGAISDLGVIAETAFLFNISLVGVGILNLAGGYLFYRSHGRPWILTIYMLAGLGATGAGLVPLNASDLHALFALTAFLFFNLEALASAAVVKGPMRWISALAGIVGLAFVVIMIIGDAGNTGVFGPIGHGGAERMIVYPSMFWMMAFGGYLLAKPAAEGRELLEGAVDHAERVASPRSRVTTSQPARFEGDERPYQRTIGRPTIDS
jgi:hypothetical membrane protein